MIRIGSHKRTVIMGALVVLTLSGALAFFLLVVRAPATPTNLYLPSMTVVYEAAGPSMGALPSTEIHRLEYRSERDWLDTILESPSFEVSSGEFSGVVSNRGSYTRLNNTTLTEYDASDDSYCENKIEPNTITLPHPAWKPYHLDLLVQVYGIEVSEAATTAEVCYGGQCEEDARGMLYVVNGIEHVFLDDPRWNIPLKVGDWFVVRELSIEQVQP